MDLIKASSDTVKSVSRPADKSVLFKVPLKVVSLPLKYREKNGLKGIL
jgi:hypothetical protein